MAFPISDDFLIFSSHLKLYLQEFFGAQIQSEVNSSCDTDKLCDSWSQEVSLNIIFLMHKAHPIKPPLMFHTGFLKEVLAI
jgi:hypothetical protein